VFGLNSADSIRQLIKCQARRLEVKRISIVRDQLVSVGAVAGERNNYDIVGGSGGCEIVQLDKKAITSSCIVYKLDVSASEVIFKKCMKRICITHGGCQIMNSRRLESIDSDEQAP